MLGFISNILELKKSSSFELQITNNFVWEKKNIKIFKEV
jgi:hypothetical protein